MKMLRQIGQMLRLCYGYKMLIINFVTVVTANITNNVRAEKYYRDVLPCSKYIVTPIYPVYRSIGNSP